jgi:prephenate dehydrogenase
MTRTPRILKEARAPLAIDKIAASIGDAVEDADLVMVAVPARIVPQVFTQIAPHLQVGVVVTDVTSTKAVVARDRGCRTTPCYGALCGWSPHGWA